MLGVAAFEQRDCALSEVLGFRIAFKPFVVLEAPSVIPKVGTLDNEG